MHCRKTAYPRAVTTKLPNMPQTFSIGGVIVAMREPTPDDPPCAHAVLVIDVGGDLARIAIPGEVWPDATTTLSVGQFIAIDGLTDSHPFVHSSGQIATRLRPAARRCN
jgi:hypothetical protein